MPQQKLFVISITNLGPFAVAADMSGCTALKDVDRIHHRILLDLQLHMVLVQFPVALSCRQLRGSTQQ